MTERLILNVICIAVLAIVLLGLLFSRDRSDIKNKRLRILIHATILFVCINIVCDALEGKPEYDTANYIFSLLTFIGIDIVIIAFNSYISALLKGAKNYRFKFMINVVVATCLIRIVLIICLACTGHLFSIKDGLYQEGDLAFIAYIFTGLTLVEMLFYIIGNYRCFSKRQFIVVLIYELIPIIPVILELALNLYSLTAPAITVSILLIYTLLQDSAFEQGELKQKMLDELSKTDLLTNLKNRRAYYEYIKNIDTNQNIGLVFCDINGLKYTNDHFGHAAGDDLILTFSKMLTKAFKKDNVFRIAGDEFVVVIEDITIEGLDNQLEKFKRDITKQDNIAAVGYSYGNASRIQTLVNEAEKFMYENKIKTGKIREI